MENNAIEYFDESGNRVAILIFDTNYCKIDLNQERFLLNKS